MRTVLWHLCYILPVIWALCQTHHLLGFASHIFLAAALVLLVYLIKTHDKIAFVKSFRSDAFNYDQ